MHEHPCGGKIHVHPWPSLEKARPSTGDSFHIDYHFATVPLQKPFDGRIVHAQQLPKPQFQKLEIDPEAKLQNLEKWCA